MFRVSTASLEAHLRLCSEMQRSTVDWAIWQIGHISKCTVGHDDKKEFSHKCRKNAQKSRLKHSALRSFRIVIHSQTKLGEYMSV